MTFASNVQPRRRVRQKPKTWKCICVVAGRQRQRPYYLTICPDCKAQRP